MQTHHIDIHRGVDSQGKSTTRIVDNRQHIYANPECLTRAYENAVTLALSLTVEQGKEEIGFPFFLVASSAWKPSRHAVRVELAFDRLDALPDVMAFLEFHQHPPFEVQSITIPDQCELFLQKSRRTSPAFGMYLPVYVQNDNRRIPGVLALEKPSGGLFSRNKRQFFAQVHLSDQVKNLAKDTGLFRTVAWQEDQALRSKEALIATVI